MMNDVEVAEAAVAAALLLSCDPGYTRPFVGITVDVSNSFSTREHQAIRQAVMLLGGTAQVARGIQDSSATTGRTQHYLTSVRRVDAGTLEHYRTKRDVVLYELYDLEQLLVKLLAAVRAQ